MKNVIVRIVGLGGLALGVSGCNETAPPPAPMPPTSACPTEVGGGVACEPEGWECPPTEAQKSTPCPPEHWVCSSGEWEYVRTMTCNPPSIPGPPAETAPDDEAPADEDAAQ